MPDAAPVVNNQPDAGKSAADATAAAASAAAATTTPVEVADKDAAELGRLMLDMGVTKDQVNDVLQAPQALAAIRYMIENDPQEFIRSLERTNPGAGENFLDKLSKLYVDRYAAPDGSKDNADKGKAADTELLQEVRSLREKVTGFETVTQQQQNAAAMAQIKARYDARVDDLFGQIPADKVPLSNYEKDLVKGKLSADLAADPNVVKRVANGNFVDVPRQFARIIEGIQNDRKSAADAERTRREASSRVTFPDFGAGPVEVPKDFYDVSAVPVDDLWNEDGLVKMLERTAR